MLESLFDKFAGLQDCCKTYLLHAHLRFYFSLGKKKSTTFYKLCFSKKCKVIFTEAYLEPNRTSTIDLFAKIVNDF